MNLLFSKKKHVPNRGKLIVVDGIPGSGKTRQIELLSDALQFAGFTVAVAKFPQAESISQQLVNTFVQKGKTTPKAEAIFFAIDRFEAKQQLQEWLALGTIVLASGYSSTNAAVGGAKLTEPGEQVKFFRWVMNLEHDTFGLPLADLNVILNISPQTALMLGKDLEQHIKGSKQEQLRVLTAQAKAYVHLAKLYPQTKLVQCAYKDNLFTPEEIHNNIWQLVRRIVLKNNLR